MKETCLICLEIFDTKTYNCPNEECNIHICEPCLNTWDKMYVHLQCPVCHTSREIHDVENQTLEIRTPERTPRRINRNQIYPLSTKGMSSRGRMLYILSTQDNQTSRVIDNYCNYIMSENIEYAYKCLKTFNCIILYLCITIFIGFVISNILFLTEYDGSFDKMINGTKDNYKEPSYYVLLSINGLCYIMGAYLISCCLYNCIKKCK